MSSKNNNNKTGTESPFRKDVLKGKVAFITGGGSGICFGIAAQFVLHGILIDISILHP